MQGLKKECISAEQDEIRQLQKAFILLEQARGNAPKDYNTTLASEVSEKDEAHQLKCSSTDKLNDLKHELIQIEQKLNRAYKKACDMNPAILKFEELLSNIEQKVKHTCPKQVTDKEFSAAIKQCIVSQKYNIIIIYIATWHSLQQVKNCIKLF